MPAGAVISIKPIRALLTVSALTLAACSTASAPFQPRQEEAGSAYGDYLAARWADAHNDPGTAVEYYRQALEKEPGSALLLERAFYAALTSGEDSRVAALAEKTMAQDPENRLARLTLAAEALSEGRYAGTITLLDDAPLGPFNRVVGSLMIAWAEAGQGDRQAALDAIAAPDDAGAFASLSGLHFALIKARFDGEDTEAAFKDALETYALPAFAVREYGRWLERQDRAGEARELYQARLAEAPNDLTVQRELQRLDAGGRTPKPPSAAEGAALGVYGPAAALSIQEQSQLAQIYLELALRLDSGFDSARILLARLVAGEERYGEAARLLEQVERGSPFEVESRILLAQIRLIEGDEAEGIAMLDAVWRDSGDTQAGLALSQALRIEGDWTRAETVADALIAQAGAAAGAELYFARAVARERLGQWREARADFEKAIALDPDHAEALNYLGYAMVERGEEIGKAMQLIEEAVRLQPEAGHIVDSLGWAHYKLGDYEAAVRELERAAQIVPADATVNDHLGDAYWRAGRKLEARFQWERALNLETDAELKAEIRAKLEDGLEARETPSAYARKP